MTTYDAGMTESASFHKLAKEAGNRLAAYITNFASGAAGVLFLAAMQDSATRLAPWARAWMLAALVLAAVTVVLRLLELHVDARRFYEVAKQTGSAAPDWARNEQLKALRLRLIFASYWSFGAALAALVGFMVARLG
jgi:hypothetical protein